MWCVMCEDYLLGEFDTFEDADAEFKRLIEDGEENVWITCN